MARRTRRATAQLLNKNELWWVHSGPGAWESGLHDYIHSSIRGFNQDYQAMSYGTAIKHAAKRSIEHVLQENNDTIQMLHSLSDQYKVQALGAASPSQDVNSCPVIQALYDSTITQQLQDLQRILSWDFQHLSPQYRQLELDKILYDNDHSNVVTRQQLYTNYGQILGEILHNLFNNPKIDSFAQLKAHLQRLQNSLAEDTSAGKIFKYTPKQADLHQNTISSGHFLSLLGLDWEDVSAALIQQGIADGLQQKDVPQEIIKVLKQQGLIDAKDVHLTFTVPNYAQAFHVGFSNKFRKNTNINVGGVVESQAAISEWANHFDDAQALEQFTYIYNNYAALLDFASENYHKAGVRGVNKRSKEAMDRRSLLINREAFQDIFGLFTQFVNLYLLQTIFLANSKDTKTPLFSPNFRQEILKQNPIVLPVFLLTRDRAYESWSIMQHMNNTHTIIWSTEELFGIHGNFRPFFPDGEARLREHYAIKRELLKRQQILATSSLQGGVLHQQLLGQTNIYQVIKEGYNQLPVKVHALFDLLPQHRTLKKKIALLDYIL